MCITPGVLLNSVGVSTSTKPGKEQQSQKNIPLSITQQYMY